jgi:lysophospholipase L1-like esterase
MLFRILFILFLTICYKFIPVFEPIGLNYLLSLLILGSISYETNKIWKKLSVNVDNKISIQKIGYLTLIICVSITIILNIHKDFPASNIRYLRSLFILITIILGGKIIKEISNTSLSNFIKNTTLVLFSTISFIAIIEICFMFISLSHGGGEAYSGKIWNMRNWNPINKFGFRDEQPLNGKNNVFFVGDSYTAGWGIKKSEDRFGEITAQILKKKGTPINEINLGRYGADTKLEYYLFENFIKKSNIKPDQVVLQFFVNDMDNFISHGNNCDHKIVEPSWKRILKTGSYLANYIFSLYPDNSENTKLSKECDYLEQLKYIYKSDNSWKKEEKQLNKFKNYCKDNNIKLTILFFPFMEDLNLAKSLNIENRINTYCKEENIELLNVTPLLLNTTRKQRQVSITDAHASPEVHKIVGEKLATIIK